MPAGLFVSGGPAARGPSGVRGRLAASAALAAILVAAIAGACARRQPPRFLPPDRIGTWVAGDVDSLPRVEYPGGGVTLNDRCMVRHVKLNRKMRPMYVNNHPVGFC